MPATAFVRARIDETLKNEAASVLAEMGLTVSVSASRRCQTAYTAGQYPPVPLL